MDKTQDRRKWIRARMLQPGDEVVYRSGRHGTEFCGAVVRPMNHIGELCIYVPRLEANLSGVPYWALDIR